MGIVGFFHIHIKFPLSSLAPYLASFSYDFCSLTVLNWKLQVLICVYSEIQHQLHYLIFRPSSLFSVTIKN